MKCVWLGRIWKHCTTYSRNCWTRELTVFETVFFTETGAETKLTEVMFSSWQSQGLSSR